MNAENGDAHLRKENLSMNDPNRMSLGEQIECHLENRRIAQALAKEHEWCDSRIAALEAELTAVTIARNALAAAERDSKPMSDAIRMTAHAIGAAVDFNEIDREDVFVDAPAHDAALARIAALEETVAKFKAGAAEDFQRIAALEPFTSDTACDVPKKGTQSHRGEKHGT